MKTYRIVMPVERHVPPSHVAVWLMLMLAGLGVFGGVFIFCRFLAHVFGL